MRRYSRTIDMGPISLAPLVRWGASRYERSYSVIMFFGLLLKIR